MDRLITKLKALSVIGLNSGTSMDGVDVALYRIAPTNGKGGLSTELIASCLHPFQPEFQRQMKRMIAQGQATLNDTCRLNIALGEVFAQSVNALIKQAGMTSKDVDLIGSHGQTIWHAPQKKSLWGVPTRATLQLGDASVIAARTGITVVSDFRTKDMAYGGQGAPLVAFADQVLFGSEGIATGVLNIGGIANITVIDEHGKAIIAFDTGPGNMIIDRAAKVLFGCEFDDAGKLAGKGKVNENWLKSLIEHSYFLVSPPKTTGREDFGEQFANHLLDQMSKEKISNEDTIATLTALTALSIADGYKRFVEPRVKISRLILGGGGAENQTLKQMLQKYWPHQIAIMRHEDFGISTKFKEALLFALLAYTTHFGIANNVPACTGATKHVSLGQICMP